MKKIIIIGFFISIFLLLSLQSTFAIKVENKNVEFDFSMSVEKKNLGWHITTTFVNTGDEWIFVEKDGYGDIGCIIYNEDDEKIWWTYNPDEGMHSQIGPGAIYESFTIWTGTDMDRNNVEEGTYKIVGAAGYFDGDTYIPLTTDPYPVEVKKTRMKQIFDNILLSRFFNWFQLINLNFIS